MKRKFLILNLKDNSIKPTSKKTIINKSSLVGSIAPKSHWKIPGFIIIEHEKSIIKIGQKDVPIITITLYHGQCKCDGAHADIILQLPLWRDPEMRKYSGNEKTTFFDIDNFFIGLWPEGSDHLRKTILKILSHLRKNFYGNLIQFQHIEKIQRAD